MQRPFQNWETWVWSMGLLAGALIAGLAIHYLAFALLKPLARRTRTVVDDSLLKHLRSPSRCLLPLIMTGLLLPSLTIPPMVGAPLRHMLSPIRVSKTA